MTTVEDMSKRARCLTPAPLAWWLANRVALLCGAPRVAVLWASYDGPYWRLEALCQVWGSVQDARRYAGPWPIIAHPPCGPWGKYRSRCHQSKEHGILAMDMVHRFGGVVEQPLGSSLFREYGAGGKVERISQGAWGFPAVKQTLLYWMLPS